MRAGGLRGGAGKRGQMNLHNQKQIHGTTAKKNKKSLILVLGISVSLIANSPLIGDDIPYDMQSVESLLHEQDMNEQEIQDLQEEIDIWQDANDLMQAYGEESMFPWVEGEDGFMEPSLDTSGTYEDYITGNEMLDYVEEQEAVPVDEVIEELQQAVQELEEMNDEIDDALYQQGYGLQ
ncbi:MAG: hypothetical protein JNM65_05240 [Verrucomicrobiaceae bacterium]|nr:hypothetical protein [Verrucomicrobiaceae bacterium]